MKLTIALFFALSGLGCKSDAKVKAAYIRDASHGCTNHGHHPSGTMWDRMEGKPVQTSGYTVYWCNQDLTMFIDDDEEQP